MRENLKRFETDSEIIARPAACRFAAESGKKATPVRLRERGSDYPGDDLLSPSTDYHRPRMLNGRVRNGNGCGHPGLLTGKLLGCPRRRKRRRGQPEYQEGSDKSCSLH